MLAVTSERASRFERACLHFDPKCAKVSDSFATQQNVVRINGQRASYMSILKNSDASTIAVVKAIREILPEAQGIAPEGLELKLDFDQSVFVQGAVDNIVHEAIISSILVSGVQGGRSWLAVCVNELAARLVEPLPDISAGRPDWLTPAVQ